MSGAAVLTASLALLLAITPGTASAELGPPTIASAVAGAQANGESSAPEVSGNGRFVVFSSTSTNLYPRGATSDRWSSGGIFRKDLDTGALDLAVPTKLDGTGGSLGAPSVSASGRYVLFTTTLSLVPSDTNGARDVYRRDMDLPIEDPSAFELVSAGVGGVPLRYAGVGALSASQSLSADGNRAIFVIASASNAMNPAVLSTATNPGAVVVRDMAAQTTTVMNVAPSGNVPLFAVAASASQSRPQISTDGTMALWLADGIGAFIGRLPDSGQQTLVERSIDRPGAAPRVVFGATDPEDPACVGAEAPTLSVSPHACDGLAAHTETFPITGYSSNRDGSTVAVSVPSRARLVLTTNDQTADIWTVDMAAAGSRKSATRRLTAGISATTGVLAEDVAMSADGSHIAFTAKSWTPVLLSPAPTGAFPPASTVNQPYLIDLGADTIQVLGTSFDGVNLNGGVAAPSLSASGGTVAFATQASNFVYGDANSATDVIVRREVVRPVPTPLDQPAPLPTALADPQPVARLDVVINPTSNGGLSARVNAPWAGNARIEVRRRSEVVRAGVKRASPQPRILEPTAGDLIAGTSRVFVVAPRRKYLADLRRKRGVPALATVTFTAAGHAPLTRSLPVTLRRTAANTEGPRR